MLNALDLFCGAGGVCAGLQQAGYEVTGIDIKPQVDYPGTFIQGDALNPPVQLKDYDFIWASPPCQGYSIANNSHKVKHPRLIEATRKMLAGHPITCIENVTGAPIREDLVLTLPMFNNFTHPHRRIFELSYFAFQPFALKKPGKKWLDNQPVFTKTHIQFIAETQPEFYQRHFINLIGAAGHGWPDTQMGERRKKLGLSGTTSLPELKAALGIYHINTGVSAYQRAALNNAVPPVYAKFIGETARDALQRKEFRQWKKTPATTP